MKFPTTDLITRKPFFFFFVFHRSLRIKLPILTTDVKPVIINRTYFQNNNHFIIRFYKNFRRLLGGEKKQRLVGFKPVPAKYTQSVALIGEWDINRIFCYTTKQQGRGSFLFFRGSNRYIFLVGSAIHRA